MTLAHIGQRDSAGGKKTPTGKPGGKSASRDALENVTQMYLERASTFARTQAQVFRSEESFWEWVDKQQGRTPVQTVLLDSRGKLLSSEEFAAWIGARREDGLQHLALAIGPADGWSDASRKRASLLLSLGPMTLAHALARLVLAEQIYRASTILTGHPYHSGH